MSDEFAAVDALAEEFQARGGQPGIAYGIVDRGRLVHARGLGERWIGGRAPDPGTVFRIASMTKSFTASAVLLLRDDGALALDDPAGAYLPELEGLRPPGDSPAITIRHLLTMTAGFPTDDPWGDRQQGLPLEEFAGILAGGVSFAWAPGTWFEYSNLGYSILGRVITAVTGKDYAEVVRDRLLRPLGMTSTGYEAAQFAPQDLARGYRRGGQGWEELVPDPYGAFAPMGGVFSSVADLARWVGGFTAAFPAGAEAAGTAHPLGRAARREMQTPQVTMAPTGMTRFPGGPAGPGPASYGFGLFIEEDPDLGTVVHHSGGYPGFGSNMRWHPRTGLGVILLANGTYAPASQAAARMLRGLLCRPAGPGGGPAGPGGRGERGPVPGPAGPPMGGPAEGSGIPRVRGPVPGPGRPWPQTLAARDTVMCLLADWDDAEATALFSGNVAQDEPLPDRRAKIAVLRERLGGLGVDPSRPAEYDSPAHCRWWVRGERGAAAVTILLTPERSPRVQALSLAVPPAPGSPLTETVAALLAVVNGDDPGALGRRPAVGSLDKAVLTRQLRMAGAWAGRAVPGACRAGNGVTSVTLELDGEHARLALAVVIDPDGVLQQAEVLLVS